MRCIIALLLGTALLGADPPFPAAAFYWDATHIVIVLSEAPNQVPQNATKMPDRNIPQLSGELFTLPDVSDSDGIKTGDTFDINLTGNFWVRATVNSFIYNKAEYQGCRLAMATIDPGNREQYGAAVKARLYVFLAEPARPKRLSDTGQIHNPLMKVVLPGYERAALEANLNEIMMKELRQAMLKEKSAPDNLLWPLLDGKAKLTVDVDQIDLEQPFGVRQHILGTWTIGNNTVFSVQGWKRPDFDQIESLEAVDGFPEDKAEIIGAIGDWGDESVDDFTIENVFAGGRLGRHSAGYEHYQIYLEQMSTKGREFERSLYSI